MGAITKSGVIQHPKQNWSTDWANRLVLPRNDSEWCHHVWESLVQSTESRGIRCRKQPTSVKRKAKKNFLMHSSLDLQYQYLQYSSLPLIKTTQRNQRQRKQYSERQWDWGWSYYHLSFGLLTQVHTAGREKDAPHFAEATRSRDAGQLPPSHFKHPTWNAWQQWHLCFTGLQLSTPANRGKSDSQFWVENSVDTDLGASPEIQ